MSVRESFVERFGEEQTLALEDAANEHSTLANSENKGSDPFKWAILICIGYACVTEERFRKYHGITIPFEDFKSWCLEKGDLGSHTGNFDYLGMFCGRYNEFIS